MRSALALILSSLTPPFDRSIKQYFFIDHGDSFSHFLDVAKHELNKKKKHASSTKLQSLLDLALRNPASASSSDPYKEDLKVSMGNSTLTEWLVKVVNVSGAFLGEDGVDALGTGMMEEGKREEEAQEAEKSASTLVGSFSSLRSCRDSLTPCSAAYEAFTLDYTVRFPLSLVISRKTILRYQLIFRHLLQLKHLERVLADTWTEHIKSPLWRKKSPYPELEQWKGRVFALRARMFAFVQQMYSFAVSGVLELNWRALEAKLEKVETVDQLLRDHVDFLDTCLKECLLTNEKLLQVSAVSWLRWHGLTTWRCSYTANSSPSAPSSPPTPLTLPRASPPLLLSSTRPAVTGPESLSRSSGTSCPSALLPSLSPASLTLFRERFEQNFNHHSKSNLERINFHASRENAALLPLVVRLTNLKIPSA